jgi:hypothetical protein
MEVVKIEQGKYYRRGDGEVMGPAKHRNEPHTNYPWNVGGCFYTGDGLFQVSGPDQVYDLVAETVCTDVLPFELKAGEKYETSNGSVVSLILDKWGARSAQTLLPFYCNINGQDYHVTRCGRMLPTRDGDEYRITAPYVAPPPTIAERLEKSLELFGDWRKGEEALVLVRGCIAELKGAKA